MSRSKLDKFQLSYEDLPETDSRLAEWFGDRVYVVYARLKVWIGNLRDAS